MCLNVDGIGEKKVIRKQLTGGLTFEQAAENSINNMRRILTDDCD